MLGIAQIASWGSLYYTLGVTSRDIARDTGTSELLLYGAFSGALLFAGVLAPHVGRLIDSAGARAMLTAGSVLASLTFALLAVATGPLTLFLAWTVGGIAIATTLYDAGFAAVSQITRTHYRSAITLLTLFGGFASTFFWPMTHALQSSLGWRDTFWVYSAMHLLLCVPLNWLALPSHSTAQLKKPVSTVRDEVVTIPTSPPSIFWLSLSFALGSAVVAVVGVHMLSLLTGRGIRIEDAVIVAMLMGPAQVLGRILEITVLHKVRASRVGLLALGAMAASLLILALAPAWFAVASCFVIIYGLGNGVLTIVRGSVPAELFGQDGLGQLLGRLSRPAMFAKALAPGLFAAVVASGVSQSVSLLGLAVIALLGLLALWKASNELRIARLAAA